MRANVLLPLVVCCLLSGPGLAQESERGVVYGEAGRQRLLLDVHQPLAPADKPRPAVVLVHGGAWSAGGRADFDDIANLLAIEGYVAFSIDYRLVTDTANRWPAQIEDCRRAVRWVRAHATRYGIDPDRIGTIGGSAGGHLVACLGTADERLPLEPGGTPVSSRVTCVVMMAGPVDLTEDLAPLVKQGEWCNEQVRRLLGGTRAELPDAARSASPLFHVDRSSAPALIIQGRNDEIVPWQQAERFSRALTAAGVDNRLVLHNGGHDVGDLATTAHCMAEMDAFLKKHLRP